MHPLDQFAGTAFARRIQTLWLVGAHRFEERGPLNQTFPNLKHIYLFEPQPEVCTWLRAACADDRRVSVFELALFDTDGEADFFVSNNEVSSSLLPLGRHVQFFPEVQFVATIRASVRTAGSVMRERGLAPPELLFMDAQGAELRILTGIPSHILGGIYIIFTEASREEFYVGSGTLEDLKQRLAGQFVFAGFTPMKGCAGHGDALFVNKKLGPPMPSNPTDITA